jgi:CRISPR-associated protein Csm5
MTRFLDSQPLCLTPLSPIHIGTGEDIDWTNAVFEGDRLVPFDPLAVNLPQHVLSELDRAASERNATKAILQLQQIFRKYSTIFAAAANGASTILPPGIANELRSKIGNNVQREDPRNPVVSQLRIERTMINNTSGRPLIPGSSLKGMLRTAEIARRDGDGNPPPKLPRPNVDSSALEELVGRFRGPFSKLSLSDLIAAEEQCSVVVTARGVRRKPRDREQGNKGIPLKVEAIVPFVAGGFSGDLRVVKSRGSDDGVPSLDFSQLLKTAHNFHINLFSFFRSQIELDPARSYLKGWLDGIEKLVRQVADENIALVRVGKYGSAESKTVANRNVRIPQAKERAKQNVLNPYTIWLADPGVERHRLPFGWALLELAEKPGTAVKEFCKTMAGNWAFREESHAATLSRAKANSDATQKLSDRISTNLIVVDRTGNRELIGNLEDLCDADSNFDKMLQNYVNQSRVWPKEDRLLLARLVRDKLRAKSKLRSFEWKNLEKLLLPITD